MSNIQKYFLVTVMVIFANPLVWGQQKKILFLGNSYTSVNDLPEKFALLALSLGDTVFFDSHTQGGSTMMNHAQNPNVLDKINAEEWDYVLIQAQSQELSFSPSQIATQVSPYAAILNDAIKANHPCSEMVFFMTWGRKYGDEQNCASWPPVCSYLGMQERLMVGNMTLAEENSATIAPVGLAWKNSMDNDLDSLINLYSSDYSHPSLAGTYLSACVLYATLFQKSPVGSNFSAGLSEYDALFLQHIAAFVVLDHDYNFEFYDNYTNIDYQLAWDSWFDFGNIAYADFSYFANPPNFVFTDHSLNAESYFWDFGDGETSSIENPMHSYNDIGEFEVKHTVYNQCFNAERNKTISIITDIEHQEIASMYIYPNPVSDHLNIEFASLKKNESVIVEVYNLGGKLISSQSIIGVNKASLQIDVSELSKGICYFKFLINDESILRKVIIE